jgi:hypothetical protein
VSEPTHDRPAANGPVLPPFFGPAIARSCTRWLCGKDAARHVIWDETMENGFVCAEHLREVGTAWSYYALHEVGPDCAMPGSEFFIEENVCRCADELAAAPVEEVVHAVA